MTPSTLALARRVRALLAEPERWTQGFYARSADGTPCSYQDPAATCWCLSGAIGHCLGGGVLKLAAHPLWGPLVDQAGGQSPAEWNDAPGRTHADVLALLDRVVERMERDGG